MTLIMLSGCSSSAQQKIADLEMENARLHAELGQTKTELDQCRGIDPAGPGQSQDLDEDGKGDALSDVGASTHFTDLDSLKGTYQTMVQELAAIGMFYNETESFRPQAELTRGEFVQWLWEAHQLILPPDKQLPPSSSNVAPYKDIPANHPAIPALRAFHKAGLNMAFGTETFRPNDPIRREEAIAMKVMVDLRQTQEPSPMKVGYVWKFTDYKTISEQFSGYIQADYAIAGPRGNNITRAFGKLDALSPHKPVLRYQGAALIWQMGPKGALNAHKSLEAMAPAPTDESSTEASPDEGTETPAAKPPTAVPGTSPLPPAEQ